MREKYMENFARTGIYAITASEASLGRSNAEVVAAMIAGGVRFIQYREKNKTFRDMYEECRVLRTLTRSAGVTFVVDDFIDLALAVDADGVHIGQTDLPADIVRKLLGQDKVIGLSTHKPADLAAANRLSGVIDYVGVGPVFATQTKKSAVPVGLDYVRHAAANSLLPYVAIGGIKEHNIAAVAAAGAGTVAVVSGIVGASDIAGQVQKLSLRLHDFDKEKEK